MGDKSKIEWTDASWTPIRARNIATGKVGWHCEHVTPGCEGCYAESMNKRFGTKLPFKPGHRKDLDIFLDKQMLLQPLRWRDPKMVFVCSMTDLFADFVPDEWIDRVFAVMALCPQHAFQVLTKRAERMRAYLSKFDERGRHSGMTYAALMAATGQWNAPALDLKAWPLPNVWLGVSAEDQKRADERIPHLLETPAAVRFVSAEPLLGEINFEEAWHGESALDPECWGTCAWCEKGHKPLYNCRNGKQTDADLERGRSGLDWIIVGGESGPNARPMHPDWARSIRDQCQTAGVRFFFKQWGEWLAGEANRGQFSENYLHAYRRCDDHSFQWPRGSATENFGTHQDKHSGDLHARRVGKRAAGRLLDSREHNEMPERAR